MRLEASVFEEIVSFYGNWRTIGRTQCWIIVHVVEPRMLLECYQPIVPNDWLGFMWPLVHWFLSDSTISHLQEELLD